MSTDEFYEDDEPIDEIRERFRRGAQGLTAPRDLSQRAEAVVDRTGAQHEANGVTLRVAGSGTGSTTVTEEDLPVGGEFLDRVNDAVTAVPYSVA